MSATRTLIHESHVTRSGKASVLLSEADGVTRVFANGAKFSVTILDGHELLPGTRQFHNEADARRYANQVWATR